jgi:hypothetical protein
MRTNLSQKIFLTILIGFSSTGFSAPTLSIKIGEGSTQQSVDKTSMASEDTALTLLSLFDVYYYSDQVELDCKNQVCQPKEGEVEPEAPLCYEGDINQVCSLLSSLSKYGQRLYTDGDHQLAQLTGCRILGRGKPVQANIQLISDYLSYKINIVQTFEHCSENELRN